MLIKILIGLRYLLAVILIGLSANGLFLFVPWASLSPTMDEFLKCLEISIFFFPLIHGAMGLCGLLLFFNLFVPLALLILLPIYIGITLSYIFIAPNSIPWGVLWMSLIFSQIYAYFPQFSHVLHMKNKMREF